ncbi:hypothetical protein [Luteimonas salinilitoris]|uniref:Uncharacterized protein n=1 Tax=Luteimonas salinilitoris TaxID=3237697 RepID=A0ABV4HTX4_9GAMM
MNPSPAIWAATPVLLIALQLTAPAHAQQQPAPSQAVADPTTTGIRPPPPKLPPDPPSSVAVEPTSTRALKGKPQHLVNLGGGAQCTGEECDNDPNALLPAVQRPHSGGIIHAPPPPPPPPPPPKP